MFRIKKLDIFMIKQFMLLFVGTFFISQFVLMMQFLWRYVDELIGKGISMEVMAQFFWYMGLSLVAQALPLALLLSSLITFGNLGESSELTAIKAAGISLMQAMRSLIVVAVVICLGSLYFQNYIAPEATFKMRQLLVSMKQKSPELEIPEGIFYDGIPGSNIYVQKKDMQTGKLYGIMIYRMTGSYEDQQIILADSGMLQTTADKQHLLLSLWSGEWFENMQSQQLGGSASVPYQRQTFTTKQLVLDYDGDFNVADASLFSADARGKGIEQILRDRDSLSLVYDSIGHSYYTAAQSRYYTEFPLSGRDSTVAEKRAASPSLNLDTLFNRLPENEKQRVVNMALSNVQLVRHEGFRVMNLLGIFIGIVMMGGIAVLRWLNNHLVYASLETYYFSNFTTLAFAYLYVYFECMLLSTILCAVLSTRYKPPYGLDYIIILGCAIRADGTPTPLLRGRAERALAFEREQYAHTGRHAKFVPSGGQGSDEIISEAESMKRWLMEQGVAKEQILEENRSVNTYQNMAFSKQVIEADAKNAENVQIGFSTTNYHVFRGYTLANRVKMKVKGLSAKTKLYFFPNAFIREFIGLLWEQKLRHLAFAFLLVASLGFLYLLTQVQ